MTNQHIITTTESNNQSNVLQLVYSEQKSFSFKESKETLHKPEWLHLSLNGRKVVHDRRHSIRADSSTITLQVAADDVLFGCHRLRRECQLRAADQSRTDGGKKHVRWDKRV